MDDASLIVTGGFYSLTFNSDQGWETRPELIQQLRIGQWVYSVPNLN